jgi:Uma2 family endonuclease
MATSTLVSVGEYLATHYRPDQEYIDGELLERNVGEWSHSRLQRGALRHFIQYEESLGFEAFPEWRVQVTPTRFRVPDVTVVRGNPAEQILTHPPFLCIEILSPEDSMTSMQERIDDYLHFGVENVWIIDPRRKKSFWADNSGIHEAANGVLRASGAPIEMDLATMWPEPPPPSTIAL